MVKQHAHCDFAVSWVIGHVFVGGRVRQRSRQVLTDWFIKIDHALVNELQNHGGKAGLLNDAAVRTESAVLGHAERNLCVAPAVFVEFKSSSTTQTRAKLLLAVGPHRSILAAGVDRCHCDYFVRARLFVAIGNS